MMRPCLGSASSGYTMAVPTTKYTDGSFPRRQDTMLRAYSLGRNWWAWRTNGEIIRSNVHIATEMVSRATFYYGFKHAVGKLFLTLILITWTVFLSTESKFHRGQHQPNHVTERDTLATSPMRPDGQTQTPPPGSSVMMDVIYKTLLQKPRHVSGWHQYRSSQMKICLYPIVHVKVLFLKVTSAFIFKCDIL